MLRFGKDISLEQIINDFDAVYISVGANEPNNTLNKTTENTSKNGKNSGIKRVLSGNKLLEEINIEKQENSLDIKYKEIFEGKNVTVNGGGNVAMDVSRTLKRLGANVTIIYRRSLNEMPAAVDEIEEAKKENIEFLFQNNIVSYNETNGEMELIKTELIKKENEQRLTPIDIENTNYKRQFDYCILATGSKPNKEFSNILKKSNIETDEKGYIKVNENYQTSNPKVFAGGDIIKSKQTVANASYDGREAAKKIIKTCYTNVTLS